MEWKAGAEPQKALCLEKQIEDALTAAAVYPEGLDACVDQVVGLLRHAQTPPEAGEGGDCIQEALAQLAQLQGLLPPPLLEKLDGLVRAVPNETRPGSAAYPVFGLAALYIACVGRYEAEPERAEAAQGFDLNFGAAFWRRTLNAYLGTSAPHKLREVERKARIAAYLRLLHDAFGKAGEGGSGRASVEHWTQELSALLGETGSLSFRFDELELEALVENTEEVQGFIEQLLAETDCSMKTQMRINVAVEEIFVNIATYAYAPESGPAWVRAFVSGEPPVLTICFRDCGVPYDPTEKEDPDVTLSAEERGVGGLGIFMAKQFMDELSYEYCGGQNVLTLKKRL